MTTQEFPLILVISNDIQELTILKAQLELSGYWGRVLTAQTPQDIHHQARQHPLGLVISVLTPDETRNSLSYPFSLAGQKVPSLMIGEVCQATQVGTHQTLPYDYTITDLIEVVRTWVPLPDDPLAGLAKTKHKEDLEYRALFHQLSAVMLLIDFETHIIIDANQRAISMYGYAYDELIGLSQLQLVPRAEHISIWSNTKRMAQQAGVLTVKERNHLKKDGTRLLVSLTASVIQFRGRKVFQDVIRDETERIRLEHERERLLKQLQQEIIERERIEEELRFRQMLLEHQQETMLDGLLVVGLNRRWLSYNQRFLDLWQIPPEIVERGDSQAALAWAKEQFADPEQFIATTELLYQNPYRTIHDEVIRKDGSVLERYSTAVQSKEGVYYGRVWFYRDITQRKQAEDERTQLIADLQQALADIKVLQGMLPICAWCKNIRDDEGYWNKLETYLTEHADILFSHDICPTCYDKVYGEFLQNPPQVSTPSK